MKALKKLIGGSLVTAMSVMVVTIVLVEVDNLASHDVGFYTKVRVDGEVTGRLIACDGATFFTEGSGCTDLKTGEVLGRYKDISVN